jgi:hypothetical protein
MSFFAKKQSSKIELHPAFSVWVTLIAIFVFAMLAAFLFAKYGGDPSSEGTLRGFPFLFFNT